MRKPGFWARLLGRSEPTLALPESTSPTEIAHTRGPMRYDSLRNELSGFGTSRDRSIYTRAVVDTLSHSEEEALWRGNDIGGAMVDWIPDECFREGFEFKSSKGKEQSEQIDGWAEELGVYEAFKNAGKQERAHGGAAIFPVILDAGDLSEPIVLDGGIPKIEALHVLERRELNASSYYGSLGDPKFGRPERYRFWPFFGGTSTSTRSGSRGPTSMYGIEIHESRLIVFPGLVYSREQVYAQQGWGDSVLVRASDVIKKFGLTWDSVSALADTFAQGVLKKDGLAEVMAEDNGGKVREQIELLAELRSLLGLMVIDGKDDYIRVQTPMSGIPEVLNMFMTRVAAAVGMTVARLFGRSASGLASTGEGDEANDNNKIMSASRHHYGPRLEQLLKLGLLSNDGPTGGQEPDVWSVSPRPLHSPTQKELAETHEIQSKADERYIEKQVLTPEQVARARFGGDTYSIDTTLSPQDLTAIRKLSEGPTPEEIAAAEAAMHAEQTAVVPEGEDRSAAAPEVVTRQA